MNSKSPSNANADRPRKIHYAQLGCGLSILGVDPSAAVLAFARRAAEGCERVRFVQADAAVFPFEPASFDATFSRFGVMFFADPTAAFINIRRSLRPNGRLAFACRRALEENPLDILPLRAASPHLPHTMDPMGSGSMQRRGL